MDFDSWFYDKNKIVQIILLIVPFVGWIMELLIRLSVLLKNKDIIHLVVFLLFLFIGWTHILEIIDLVFLIVKGRLIFA